MIRTYLSEEYPDTLMLPEQYDEAILCVVDRIGMAPFVVYDTDKVIKVLMDEGMEYEEAIDYFGFNIQGSFLGETTPGYTIRIEE